MGLGRRGARRLVAETAWPRGGDSKGRRTTSIWWGVGNRDGAWSYNGTGQSRVEGGRSVLQLLQRRPEEFYTTTSNPLQRFKISTHLGQVYQQTQCSCKQQDAVVDDQHQVSEIHNGDNGQDARHAAREPRCKRGPEKNNQ